MHTEKRLVAGSRRTIAQCVCCLALGMTACTTTSLPPSSTQTDGLPAEAVQTNPVVDAPVEIEPIADSSDYTHLPEPEHAWQYVTHRRHIDTQRQRAEVASELNWLIGQRESFERKLRRAEPYLGDIIAELDRRDMPLELALLPVIESGFNPNATSRKGAAGLWQIMPGTARDLKTRESIWFDGRRDPRESTSKALDYLQLLEQRYAGDWLLALAAYNAGYNKVDRAIRKTGNPQAGFWSLSLPRETRHYVPRFLALVEFVRHASDLGLDIPAIPRQTLIQQVVVDKPLDLKALQAKLGTDDNRLLKLNAGYIRAITPGGDAWPINVPLSDAENITKHVSALPPVDLSRANITHRIRRGETLSHIARRYGVSVRELQRANRLSSTRIRAGKKLIVPAPRAFSVAATPGTHVVRRGDTLWEIAKRYDISVKQLLRLNNLDSNRVIKPGNRLQIR